eukprot:8598849-Prorocentrum_lima.AAC.1
MFYKKLLAPVRMVVVADAAYNSNETSAQIALHYVAFSYCLVVVIQRSTTVAPSSFAAELHNTLEAAQAG